MLTTPGYFHVNCVRVGCVAKQIMNGTVIVDGSNHFSK